MNAYSSSHLRRNPRTLPILAAVAALFFSTFAFAAAPAGATPYCESSSSDPDGDGWGWENNQSCRVQAETSAIGPCRSSASDPDGDGWGWEDNRSCLSALATDTAAGKLAAEYYNQQVRNGYTYWSVNSSRVYMMKDRDWSNRMSIGTRTTSDGASSFTIFWTNEWDRELTVDSNTRNFAPDGSELERTEHDWGIIYDIVDGERTVIGTWSRETNPFWNYCTGVGCDYI